MKETQNENKNKAPKPGENKPKFNFYWIYGLLALVFVGLQLINWDTGSKDLNKGELLQMLQEQEISKIDLVNREIAEVYLTSDARKKYFPDKDGGGVSESLGGSTPDYIYRIGSIEGFEKDIMAAQEGQTNPIYINNVNRRNWSGEILGWILPIALLIGVWFFIMRMMSRGGGGAGGQIFNIGKSKAQLFDKNTNVNVTFKDVAGLEEAKVEIMEIVDFLRTPEKYTKLGGKIPKGVLLVGPPGTGKTLLAKSVAGEAHVPFYSISGSDFVEMFVGVGASRVRDLFKQAKEKSPCIIFIDEIDAIGRARGKNPATGANDERENTLNQLLTEMDGFGTNSGVIVLAATNRADILDRALMRAGRFDRQIYVELPDLEGRKEIFEVHMRPLKLDPNVNMEFLAKQTPGFSGADIANVCNEAALIAARRNRESINKQDFMDAIDRIIGGLEKKNKIISPSEKKVVAFHEAGHASVSWLLEHAHPLVKVTIVPRGKSLGAAWYLPEERQITTYNQMFDEMTAALGGRAAEKVIFGQISTGALSDLEKVTKQAYAMVTYYGLSEKIGNVSFYDSTGQQEYAFNKPFSEKTNEVIDSEISDMVEKAYQRALKLLSEHKDGLTKLAEKLLEKEVIFGEDLENIFGKRPWIKEERPLPKKVVSENKPEDKTETAANDTDTTTESDKTKNAHDTENQMKLSDDEEQPQVVPTPKS
ncbi:MAG: ATP-dependent zinc metalloprotease FtsH [Bacteroidales bacterium]|jgi:cell division protease FtsH|nr:ATP-dependent zinc metalloprotease FtsH [Bacteroidales bacterium]MDD4087055.1 ATP-dependent zinc metalloprotease FtsH [Bacteroidales bacterium]